MNFSRKITTSLTGTQQKQVSDLEGHMVFGAFSLLMGGLILDGIAKVKPRKS
ncbi:MAG: hypothetical protein Q8K83_00090 [Methylotenera sp.]|nr:hypothetical protein [Methylotenera sp.]